MFYIDNIVCVQHSETVGKPVKTGKIWKVWLFFLKKSWVIVGLFFLRAAPLRLETVSYICLFILIVLLIFIFDTIVYYMEAECKSINVMKIYARTKLCDWGAT